MRILYGVNGEGNGHVMRSLAVIEYLKRRGHTIEVCASGNGLQVFPRVAPTHELPHVPLVYVRGRIAYARSALKILRVWPRLPSVLRELEAVCARFRPDVIVSDYETFTARYGRRAGIPVISANNISVTTQARLPFRVPSRAHAWMRIVEPLMSCHPARFVIPVFFTATPRAAHVLLTPPGVRAAIRKLRARRGKHILVYQTSSTNEELLTALKGTPERYIVYGYGARPKDGNLTFYGFNEGVFLTHLSSAKATILGGGFTLITEALWLRKPILSVPMLQHYEQAMNAAAIAHEGYGAYSLRPTPADVDAFLAAIPSYEKKLRGLAWDPDAFAKAIEASAKELAGK